MTLVRYLCANPGLAGADLALAVDLPKFSIN